MARGWRANFVLILKLNPILILLSILILISISILISFPILALVLDVSRILLQQLIPSMVWPNRRA